METGADDAEPTHITGGGGGRTTPNVMSCLKTSYDNHTISGQSPKCHMSCFMTSDDNHTILDRPPNVMYDLIHND